MSSGLSYFTFDGQIDRVIQHGIEVSQASKKESTVNVKFLQELFEELIEINKFVKELREIGIQISATTPEDWSTPEFIATLNVPTHTMQIGCIRSDSTTENLKIYYEIDGVNKYLNANSELVEPLCYPLLFPFGETGWSTGRRKTVPFMSYLSARILQPELGLAMRNSDGTTIFPTNRFQLMARLSQYYVTEELSRAIDYRLNWNKNNQGMIFGEHDNGNVDESIDETALNIFESSEASSSSSSSSSTSSSSSSSSSSSVLIAANITESASMLQRQMWKVYPT